MISVCVATFNGEKFIKEQIESILCQIGKNDEVVISDDGSTDSTLDILESFHDSRIKINKNYRITKGKRSVDFVTRNFENALNHVKGDIIFLSDQDDVWCENKVSKMLLYLEDNDYVVSDCYVTDSNLNVIHNTRFYVGSGLTKNKWKALLMPTPYQGSCAAFKRRVLDIAMPFPVRIQSHDRWIGFVASFFFKYKILDEPLIYYRRHEGVTSTASTNKKSNTLSYKLLTRGRYVWELVKRGGKILFRM